MSFCGMCPAHCGLEVAVGEVARVGDDRAHPLTRGFTSAKGRHVGDLHAAPERLVESQRRGPAGTFQPAPLQPLDPIDAGRAWGSPGSEAGAWRDGIGLTPRAMN